MSNILSGVDTNVAFDSSFKTSGSQSPADIAVPISFAGGAATTFITRTIPGGVLGNHGFCVVQVSGAFAITANATVVAADGVITACSSQNMPADNWYFVTEYRLQNRGAENDQLRSWKQDFTRQSAASFNGGFQNTTTTDTSSDWTLTLTLQSSIAVTTARIDAVRVQTYFLP